MKQRVTWEVGSIRTPKWISHHYHYPGHRHCHHHHHPSTYYVPGSIQSVFIYYLISSWNHPYEFYDEETDTKGLNDFPKNVQLRRGIDKVQIQAQPQTQTSCVTIKTLYTAPKHELQI